jgi:hypothetical protein
VLTFQPKEISTVLIVMAMQHEAAPIIDKLGLQILDNASLGLLGPMVAYKGVIGTGSVYLVLNGDTHVYETTGFVFVCSWCSVLILQEGSREERRKGEGESCRCRASRIVSLGRHSSLQA